MESQNNRREISWTEVRTRAHNEDQHHDWRYQSIQHADGDLEVFSKEQIDSVQIQKVRKTMTYVSARFAESLGRRLHLLELY